MSKTYEDVYVNRITIFDCIFFKFHCGSKKVFSAGKTLLSIAEKCRKYIGTGDLTGVFLIELPYPTGFYY